MDITDEELHILKKKLLKDFNLDIQNYKDNFLKRRLGVRMRAVKAKNGLVYARLLSKDHEEYLKLIDALAINVSEFFRDSEVFEAIQYIIADIAMDRPHQFGSRVEGGRDCAGGYERSQGDQETEA